MATNKKTVYIIVNVDWFFLSHRLPVALAAQEAGFDVTIVCADTGKIGIIRNYGFNVIDLPLSRGYSNIISEVGSLFFLTRLYRKISVGIIHQVGLKLILIGTIAHTLSFSKATLLNALSGAGTMFTSKNRLSFKFRILLRAFAAFSKKESKYIFQNSDDVQLFENILGHKLDFEIVKGSGVDLKLFDYSPPNLRKPYIFLFVGRLIKEKGIIEFLNAAKSVRKTGNDCTFIVAGALDFDNPSSLSQDDLIEYEHVADFIGHQSNISELIAKSFCVVLPSHREGLPKSLIEACAVGRPIITTDAIGCKETVMDGKNGFLVPINDHLQIVDRIYSLINNPSKAIEMGISGREKAKSEFDIKIIKQQTIQIYKTLLG